MQLLKSMNKQNYHNRREGDSGIDHIFLREKWSEFDEASKKSIITAYRLAVALHK